MKTGGSMKKTILFSILVCLAITLTAKVSLFVTLDKVVKEPAGKAMKVGENGEFSDSLISIVWQAGADGFQFQLTNKTDGKLVIPWTECRFINELGESFTVVHGDAGTTVEIAAQAVLTSAVAPVDYFYWKKGWATEAIFLDKMSDEEFEKIKDKDLIYKVVLPIRKGQVKTVYHFIFKTMAE
jgi:hypothetical protein